MSKVATAGLIVVALVVLIGGVTFGLRLGYSQFAAVSFGLLPAMVILFPVVRERSGGKLTLAQWIGILFITTLFATVFNNLLAATVNSPGG